MNQHVIHHLSLIAESHNVYAEDLSDQLMSKYTSMGLMVLATLLVMKQYFFKSIQCFVPAEWPRPYEEYAENYCWIQNTYNVAVTEPGFPGLQKRKEAEISYFQWIPILLSIQAVLVLVPHLVWRLASARTGSEVHRIVKLATELEETESERKQKKLALYLSNQLRRSISVAAGVTKSRLSCCQSGRCEGCLFVSYIASKVVYLLSGLGQLFLMKFYLGYKELHFGWSTTRSLLSGRQWQQTGVFPRVTFCDVPIKNVGQWNIRSVQCVLPANMLNEKIYIFLWFWTVLCMALQVAYGLHWIASLAPRWQRLRFVRNLLRLERPHTGLGPATDTPAMKDFMRQSLRLDGVFILHMVAVKCGDLCAAKILAPMLHEAPDHDAAGTNGKVHIVHARCAQDG